MIQSLMEMKLERMMMINLTRKMLFSVCGVMKIVGQEVTIDTIGNGIMYRNMQNKVTKIWSLDLFQKKRINQLV